MSGNERRALSSFPSLPPANNNNIMAVGQQLDISSAVAGGLPAPLPDDVCKTYDVTSKWDPYVLFCCGLMSGFPCLFLCAEKKTLTIETEEVVLNINNGCENKNKRVPYGELGSVDQSKSACGCFQIGGNSIGRFSPGWGGEKELPEMLEILATLKRRQQQRGDQGQIQRTEKLERKIDAIIEHFRIKVPDDDDDWGASKSIDEAPRAASMKR